jgi:hypothetical protein
MSTYWMPKASHSFGIQHGAQRLNLTYIKPKTLHCFKLYEFLRSFARLQHTDSVHALDSSTSGVQQNFLIRDVVHKHNIIEV